MPESPADPPSATPVQVIGKAIQDMTAARLGRGFIPVALLGAIGVVQLVTAGGSDPGGWALVGGALSVGGAMLGYGLRVVQRAFGRAYRPWMTGAMVASLSPPFFVLYVLGWRGLRGLTADGGVTGVLMALVFISLGVWLLRAWMKVQEVDRLARVMASNLEEYRGSS